MSTLSISITLLYFGNYSKPSNFTLKFGSSELLLSFYNKTADFVI